MGNHLDLMAIAGEHQVNELALSISSGVKAACSNRS